MNEDTARNARNPIRLFWNALKKFDDDQAFFLASGITFSLLICLIPLILLILALLGTYLYTDGEVFIHVQRYLAGIFPSLDPGIMANISTIIQDRQVVGLLGIGGLLWVSTWVFRSLRTALNIIFQAEKGRSLFRGIAVDFFMVLLAGSFLLMSMFFTSLITVIQTYRFASSLDIGPMAQFIFKYPLPFFLTFWMSFLIYKIAPNKKVSMKPAMQAALFTSLLWEIAKHLFGWYVLHLGRFSMIYGSLSTVAIFFLWIYYSSAILLLGGEIAALLESGKGKSSG